MAAPAEPRGLEVHLDGSMCLQGTTSVPKKGFRPCCREFEVRLSVCAHSIRYEYWSEPDRWYIITADGSYEGIRIRHCPHCGARLPRRH